MLSSLAFRSAAAVLAAGALSAAPALAHDYWNPQAGRAIQLYTQGGAYSPLADLDDGGQADFRTGFAVGGGAAYQFNEHVAVRAGIHFARAEARVADPLSLAIDSIDGKKFNRYLFDADVQLRYPLQSGLTPYVFAGAGGVTVERDVARMRSRFSRLAGKTGVGIGYLLPDRNVGLHLEAAGWLYQWDRYGFDRTQLDATLNAGISYRFALR
jgi:opacity protein-like surface antigen